MPKKNVNTLSYLLQKLFFFFKEKHFRYMCVPLLSFIPFFPKARTLMKLMVNPPSTFVVNRYIQIDRHIAICILQYTLF